LVILVLKAYRVLLAQLALPVRKVQKDQQAHKVLLEQLDRKDPKVKQVLKDLQGKTQIMQLSLHL
jgi:hypothetical protein